MKPLQKIGKTISKSIKEGDYSIIACALFLWLPLSFLIGLLQFIPIHMVRVGVITDLPIVVTAIMVFIFTLEILFFGLIIKGDDGKTLVSKKIISLIISGPLSMVFSCILLGFFWIYKAISDNLGPARNVAVVAILCIPSVTGFIWLNVRIGKVVANRGAKK